MTDSHLPGSTRRHTAWVLAILALVSVAVYANALGNGFAFDDTAVIVDNERVHDLALLPRLFTEPFWDAYRPVTLTTFALEWAVGGGDPLLHHATNVLLHAGVTCLLFLFLLRLGAANWGAGAGAALFAVHPVHVEAVANIAGRAELLMALFTLAALLVHTSGRSRLQRTIGVGLLLALALGSKENGVVLPALMLVSTAFLAPTAGAAWRTVRRDLPVYGAVMVVGLAYAVVRRTVVGTFTVFQTAYGFDLGGIERVLTAISVWPEYVRLLFFPLELSIDYGPAVLLPARTPTLEAVLGAVVGSACLALVPLLWHRQRWVSLSVAWFALAIFPVSNLVVPVGIWLAERNLYLPSVTIAMLATAIVGAVVGGQSVRAVAEDPDGVPAPRSPTPAVTVVVLLLVALGSWRTWTRTPIWESSDTALFSLMEEHPESFRAQWHMAKLLSMRDEDARALEYMERAVELTPGHGQVLLEYARILGLNDRPAEAEAVLRENAWMNYLPDWSAYLTYALLDQGRTDEALEVAEEGVRLNPSADQALRALELARAGAASRETPRVPPDSAGR